MLGYPWVGTLVSIIDHQCMYSQYFGCNNIAYAQQIFALKSLKEPYFVNYQCRYLPIL